MKRFLICLIAVWMSVLAAIAVADDYPSYSQTPHAYSVAEFDLESGDQFVYGMLYLPEGEGPFPTVIMSHGFGSDEGVWTYTAHALASSGFVCYAFDFCGGNTLGRSDGSMLEMSAMTEKADLLAIIDQITEEDFCDTNNLFLMGESMGGLVSTLAAAERADVVKAIALYYPAFNMPENARSLYASADEIGEEMSFLGMTIGKPFYADVLELDVSEVIGTFEIPVCIVHGDRDIIVPLESSEAAAGTLAHCEMTALEGEGHGFSAGGQARASRIAYDFFSALIP